SGSFGSNVLSGVLVDRYNIPDTNWQLAVRGAASKVDNATFYGIGWDTKFDNTTRFQNRRVEGSASATYRFSGLSSMRLEGGYRDVTYHDKGCCSDPSIGEGVMMGLFPAPPGFSEGGFAGPFSHAQLVLDSRPEAPSTGVALAVDAEQGSDTRTN